jgi:signal transduction histidine kinase
MIKRTQLVYGVLLTVWAVLVVWQVVEHDRLRRSAGDALINRAKDISNTLGLVMRSQRRFGGVISKERLESALNSLVKPGEVNAIALLNAAGNVVASAGAPIDLETKGLVSGAHWAERTVTLMNLVDLGTNITAEAEAGQPTIVLPRTNIFGPFGTNRPPPPPPDMSEPDRLMTTNSTGASNLPPRRRGWPRPRGGEGRPPFGRPPWMSEEEYKAVIKKQGVHSFLIVLSTQSMRAAAGQDLWLRLIISALASVSVVGLGSAWRNLAKSSELEVRLVRAAELNARLKEMNLAAAGLAHETKNPLNIIRGLAQMISKQEDGSAETRHKSRDIIDEADRVTAQLNEFINFSRPREVRCSAVTLSSVVGEVVRTLGHDLEEKAVRLQVQDELPRVEADEQLLRQALFNLLLNAIQAAAPSGEIQVVAAKAGAEATLEIRDNGPGVPAEHRTDIFKPYFTRNQKGTGLGLAVVQQIVLAHGWEIECLANQPAGAVFRISHLRLAANA